MKLNPNFITRTIEDTQFLVPVEQEAFRGLVRSNSTAAFIVDCLKEDTTMKQIVEAVYAKYDAPKETIAKDVKRIIGSLKEIGAIVE